MTAVQPDLFGEYDAALTRGERARLEQARVDEEQQRVLAEHRARFAVPGTDGLRCPACGHDGMNRFLLQLNHGWRLEDPRHRPRRWGDDQRPDTCDHLEHLRRCAVKALRAHRGTCAHWAAAADEADARQLGDYDHLGEPDDAA